MKKMESRHQLILSLVLERKIQTQETLRKLLKENGIDVTQSTLSRDIKLLNLVKVTDAEQTYYAVNPISPSRWEKRLRLYMEDALVMLHPVQHQVILKTLPGLANSFGSILDAMELPEILATVCGDDVCLIICADTAAALSCYDTLKTFAPPFFFGNQSTR